MTTAKWFYAGVEQASKSLQDRYEFISCNYQLITKDRVIESWQCQHSENDASETVFVVITNQGRQASVLIYKGEFLRGWPVENICPVS